MSKKATKAADNIYYKARMEAAAANDKLNSREGAAELIGIDRTRLARIKLDSICAYPEEVLMMSDIYNAPELNNYFCCRQCPIGKNIIPPIEIMGIQGLTLNIVSCLRNAIPIENNLIEISKDGIVSEDELPRLKETVDNLEEISKYVQSLKVLVMKRLKSLKYQIGLNL